MTGPVDACMADIDREDEALMTAGLGWREAAAITNELVAGTYAIAGRVQEAADRAAPPRRWLS